MAIMCIMIIIITLKIVATPREAPPQPLNPQPQATYLLAPLPDKKQAMFQGSSQLRSSKLYNHGSSARVKRSCLGLGVFRDWDLAVMWVSGLGRKALGVEAPF